MLTWHLEKRLLKDLKDHPKNPRKISKKDIVHLEHSLKRFGVIDRPVITPDGLIIGGHQRKRILKNLGITEVDCWVPERPLTDEEVDELNIRLNKNQGEWDFEILSTQWDVEKIVEFGFDPKELELPDVTEVTEDKENILEPKSDEESITTLGDVYEIHHGGLIHRVVCGDSTMPEDVEKALEGAEPVLMITDPPYGVKYDASWREVAGKGARSKGKVENDDQVDWRISYSLFPGSIAYVWHAGKHSAEVARNLEDCDFEIVSQIIWNKQHFALSREDYHWKHEACWYAVKKGHQHNWKGDRKQSTVWDIANLNCFGKSKDEDQRTSHSTQKPLECMSRPIKNNSQKGEGIYDPFLGSGTTLIAADTLGRACYGLEISPAYCDLIISRYLRHAEKKGREVVIYKNGNTINNKDFLNG